MRKIIALVSFVLNIIALVYITCSGKFVSPKENKTVSVESASNGEVSAPTPSMHSHINKEGNSGKNYKIAVLTPASHPALAEVERGFEETLVKDHGIACDFDIYNANGNRVLMRSQIEEIIQKDYDLLFTIGAHATLMAKEVTAKKQNELPIVFGGVADPVRLTLVKSEASSDNNLTGAGTSTNYPDQIALLLLLKPSIKKALIVYDPTQSSGLERDKNEVANLLLARGVAVSSAEIYKTSEIHQKIGSLLSGVDVVIVFKDNTIVSGIDALVKLCTRHGITLFASDLDSVDKGAALGFGVHEYDFGAASAQHALQVLLEKKHPSHIPITFARHYKIRLNTKMMESQGLNIDSKMFLLMKSIEVV